MSDKNTMNIYPIQLNGEHILTQQEQRHSIHFDDADTLLLADEYQNTVILKRIINKNVKMETQESVEVNTDSEDLAKAFLDYSISETTTKNTTTKNISINHIVADDSEWIYYSNFFGIYKMPKKGGERILLTDQHNVELRLINGTIYYIGMDPDSGNKNIYKINTDGENKVKIVDNISWSMDFIDNSLYFMRDWDLYRVDLDSTHKEILFKEDVRDYIITNSGLFYYRDPSNEDFYRLNIETNEKTTLPYVGSPGSNIVPNDDWIYFTDYNGAEDPSIFKMEANSGTISKIDNVYPSYYFVSDDFIYYSNTKDEGKLYKVNRYDGTGITKLSDDPEVEDINVVDDYVYYRSPDRYSCQYIFYRIKNDGTNKLKISDVVENEYLNSEHKNINSHISRYQALSILSQRFGIPLYNTDTYIMSSDNESEYDEIIDGIRYYNISTISRGDGGAAYTYYISEETGEIYIPNYDFDTINLELLD